MYDAIAGMPTALVLCGVIWSVALGFTFGNYACSLIHRLPRGRLILDKKPYCGSCGTLLQVRDLFPVVSALLLKHRCRYCHKPYPVSHTWTELLVGLLFVLTFLEWGFSEQYLMIVFIGTFLVILAAIETNEGVIMKEIMLCVAVSAMIYRTLEDGTIYGFFIGGLQCLVLGAILWRRQIKRVGHVYTLPKPALLLALGGVCVGVHGLASFLVLFAYFYVLGWLFAKLRHYTMAEEDRNPPITIPFGFAALLPVLYAHLFIF